MKIIFIVQHNIVILNDKKDDEKIYFFLLIYRRILMYRNFLQIRYDFIESDNFLIIHLKGLDKS